jgi:hypothetical protein
VSPLRLITGASPLPEDCGVPGTPYRGAEVEPTLAVDPRNPRRLVAAWQQDRFPDGGALSSLTASSTNGGKTWRDRLVRGVSRCTGGDYGRASDPWLAIGPEGTTYLATLPSDATLPAAMIVNRSTKPGGSWSAPIFVERRTDLGVSNDKETVTADPFRPGIAYMVWVQSRLVSTPSGVWFPHDLYFARTRDGGRTWSAPNRIHAAMPDETRPLLPWVPSSARHRRPRRQNRHQTRAPCRASSELAPDLNRMNRPA